MVKASNLRGRGGAGFPTGMKWSFLPKQTEKPVYLCVNADESEPGTFKDRQIIEYDPHQLLEGVIISAYAIKCHTGLHLHPRRVRSSATSGCGTRCARRTPRGYLGKNILGTGFDLDVVVHRGAGAYICGEETGLHRVARGQARLPAHQAAVPGDARPVRLPDDRQQRRDARLRAAHRRARRRVVQCHRPGEESRAEALLRVAVTSCGPGIYELPMGTPLREIIYEHAGGIPNGRELKAVIPGGASMPLFTADEIDVPMDFDSVAEGGLAARLRAASS